jgi:hypothetical protein
LTSLFFIVTKRTAAAYSFGESCLRFCPFKVFPESLNLREEKMTEVGVTLALRKQTNLLDSSGKAKRRRGRQSKSKKKNKIVMKRKSNSSLRVFIEGATLYTLCIVLPGVLGLIVGIMKGFWTENLSTICSIPLLASLNWCKQILLGSIRSESNSKSLAAAIAPDAGISDVGIVAFLSLSMAVIRLALVHLLVPDYNQPKRMKALVRCKSIHLLSSQYTGNGTPRPIKQTTGLDDNAGLAMLPTLSSLKTDNKEYNGLLEEKLEPKSLFASDFGYSDKKFGNGYGNWDLSQRDDESEEDKDEFVQAPAVSSGLISSSSANSLQALLHQANPLPTRSRTSISSKKDDAIIFTAPKFATAAFRLFYCSFSCIIALFYFLDANFWPPAVGGTGNTKNCWDLSSVGATLLDSDFDHYNTSLRRFFLLQASYHFHSAAFHLFTALLLWFVSASSKNSGDEDSKFFGFIPSGMITVNNIKTLLQHCFAVGLITFIYLFSSLRRLGAIGIFSFDASSWALHLLQLCINDTTQRVTPSWIRILHRILVIPFFCYTRFYIFPFVIGYSSLEESQDWLQQLENMLVPGVARYIHGFFVVVFCLILMINLVYFRRLVNHPHINQTLQRLKQDKAQ